MKNPQSIYHIIKQDFCDLLDYKIRGNTLELSTNVSTIGQSFVSVFVSWDGSKFVASDGGWINEGMYSEGTTEDEDLIDRLTSQFISYYEVKNTFNSHGTKFYYKTCPTIELVSGIAHDMSMFIQGVVNARLLNYESSDLEVKQSQQFSHKVNSFIRQRFGESRVHLNHPIVVDSGQQVKINAFVQVPTQAETVNYMMMYVTGHRKDLFNKDLSKATVVLKVLQETATLRGDRYRRIAIVNKSAAGYSQSASGVFMQELAKITSVYPLLVDDNNLVPSFMRLDN